MLGLTSAWLVAPVEFDKIRGLGPSEGSSGVVGLSLESLVAQKRVRLGAHLDLLGHVVIGVFLALVGQLAQHHAAHPLELGREIEGRQKGWPRERLVSQGDGVMQLECP